MEGEIDLSKWPGPVVRLYLGPSTPEALLAGVDDLNAETKKRRVCRANLLYRRAGAAA